MAHERWAAAAEQDGRELELAGNGDATIAASEEDLAILLDNLIENALRYSPTRVELDWGRDGDEAWLAVLDEGPGLAPGEETSLFDRFARGSAGSSRPGTGLGLAIVQTLARRWRGSASLANRLEGGTRAEVRFPAAATVAEESWVEALVVAVLALVGLLCAAGMGYAAYVVSRDSVAVPVTKLQPVPKQLTPARVKPRVRTHSRPVETTTTTTRTGTTTVDDHGGRTAARGNSGHGGGGHGSDD